MELIPGSSWTSVPPAAGHSMRTMPGITTLKNGTIEWEYHGNKK